MNNDMLQIIYIHCIDKGDIFGFERPLWGIYRLVSCKIIERKDSFYNDEKYTCLP